MTEYYCETCANTHEFKDEWSDLQSKTLCLSQSSNETPEAISQAATTSDNKTMSIKVSCRFKDGMRAVSNVYDVSTRPITNSSLTGFTKEEINYAKMGMILLNILIDVLYDLLKQDKTFLRPRSDCDITYLYKEHRRIDKHKPSIGWGGTWLDIQSTNITIGDDIERIRNTRNELQHCKTFMLDDKRFNDLYDIIVDLLDRFDHHNKPSRLYTDQLNEIVAKTISAEELKAVENKISEMTIEVEIQHLVNVTPQ
ncbi:unnamed protein product [Mytilus edulis]|uniref:DZIP3-like HEPN domain-containing protein n=1 Tax=Mytilus edulis TaxID=6550 RepID=A0A8S3TYG9_MYTED|nr:unnamed protein product [Mytilus edulis]